MSSKVYDVVAAMGKYTDKSGDEKTRWQNCGVILKTQKGGLALKLESIPVGNTWEGWFNLFEPKQQQAPSSKVNQGRATGDFDDDIPFN